MLYRCLATIIPDENLLEGFIFLDYLSPISFSRMNNSILDFNRGRTLNQPLGEHVQELGRLSNQGMERLINRHNQSFARRCPNFHLERSVSTILEKSIQNQRFSRSKFASQPKEF